MLRRSLCCSSHRAIAEHGSAACSAVRGAMKNNPEREGTVPFPLPAKSWEKKLSHIPAIPLTVLAVCFPFIFVIISHTGVVEFTAVCRQ